MAHGWSPSPQSNKWSMLQRQQLSQQQERSTAAARAGAGVSAACVLAAAGTDAGLQGQGQTAEPRSSSGLVCSLQCGVTGAVRNFVPSSVRVRQVLRYRPYSIAHSLARGVESLSCVAAENGPVQCALTALATGVHGVHRWYTMVRAQHAAQQEGARVHTRA